MKGQTGPLVSSDSSEIWISQKRGRGVRVQRATQGCLLVTRGLSDPASCGPRAEPTPEGAWQPRKEALMPALPSQAVMSSDFAISRFRHLKKLLLVHGHWCYSRLARMVVYYFYKNVVSVPTATSPRGLGSPCGGTSSPHTARHSISA